MGVTARVDVMLLGCSYGSKPRHRMARGFCEDFDTHEHFIGSVRSTSVKVAKGSNARPGGCN